jgi:hypothetical protein
MRLFVALVVPEPARREVRRRVEGARYREVEVFPMAEDYPEERA